jgi:hypothetical protein
MKKNIKIYRPLLLLNILSFFLFSCEKTIDISVPDAPSQIVVDGSIESDGPPIVVLTSTTPYFAETGANELYDNFVHDANISITVDGVVYPLTEVCSDQIPDSLLGLFMETTGIVIPPDADLNICLYTDLSFTLFGENGKTYLLDIEADGNVLSAVTNIPNPVPLDSVWFQVEGTLDSLGLAWAILSDPDTIGNAYRWSAKRINHYPDGTVKDPVYIPPFNSVTDDQFFNGLTFEFSNTRGMLPYSNAPDDNNEEAFFFKIGDTIAVKGMSTNIPTFLFLRSYYSDLANQGSPFAAPASLKTNVTGGLGIWAGYGIFRDTIYATP